MYDGNSHNNVYMVYFIVFHARNKCQMQKLVKCSKKAELENICSNEAIQAQ